MKSGIYLITSPNGKRYIGSAANLSVRRSVHWHQLSRGVHHNAHLQRSWQRCGGEGFSFRVLLVCSKENLLLYEQLLLDGLAPEFNICRIAGSSAGVTHTPQTREKYRRAMRLRIQSDKAAHAAVTARANRATRERHKDPQWRETWLASVRAHGETMAKMVTWQGRTQSVTAWAKELGVPRTTLKHRLNKHGPDVAFGEPAVEKGSQQAWLLRNKNRGLVAYTVDGTPVTKTEFARHIGISRVTLRQWELAGLNQDQMTTRAEAR